MKFRRGRKRLGVTMLQRMRDMRGFVLLGLKACHVPPLTYRDDSQAR